MNDHTGSVGLVHTFPHKVSLDWATEVSREQGSLSWLPFRALGFLGVPRVEELQVVRLVYGTPASELHRLLVERQC